MPSSEWSTIEASRFAPSSVEAAPSSPDKTPGIAALSPNCVFSLLSPRWDESLSVKSLVRYPLASSTRFSELLAMITSLILLYRKYSCIEQSFVWRFKGFDATAGNLRALRETGINHPVFFPLHLDIRKKYIQQIVESISLRD